MQGIRRSLGAALFALGVAGPTTATMVAAQAPASSPDTSGRLAWQASLRVRPESWDWFGADGGQYGYVGAIGKVALLQEWARVRWRVELAAPALLGLPDDAVRPPPQGQLGLGAAYWAANDSNEHPVGLFVKQAWLRFGAAQGHALRLGRFEYADGAETTPANATLAATKRDRIVQRLVGPFGWSHVGRSFDGAHYAFVRPATNVSMVAALPTRGAFDVDGWPSLNVRLGYGAITKPFAEGAAEWRLFALGYQDRRDVVKADNRPAAARAADREDVAMGMLGAHVARVFGVRGGEIDVLLWGVAQAGSWGAQDHRAHAEVVEVGWQPPKREGALRPWLRVGWNRGSGDDGAADDEHGTFFQVLPTPRIHARFPFHNLMNLEDVFASVALRGGALGAVTVRADGHRLWLANGRDLWYGGGGAFEPQSFGIAGRPSNGARALAGLFDLSADWRMNAHVSLNAYAAVAPSGDVVDRTYPDAGTGRLVYAELELRR